MKKAALVLLGGLLLVSVTVRLAVKSGNGGAIELSKEQYRKSQLLYERLVKEKQKLQIDFYGELGEEQVFLKRVRRNPKLLQILRSLRKESSKNYVSILVDLSIKSKSKVIRYSYSDGESYHLDINYLASDEEIIEFLNAQYFNIVKRRVWQLGSNSVYDVLSDIAGNFYGLKFEDARQFLLKIEFNPELKDFLFKAKEDGVRIRIGNKFEIGIDLTLDKNASAERIVQFFKEGK